eukprot:1436725-Rhodomonas_salina.2
MEEILSCMAMTRSCLRCSVRFICRSAISCASCAACPHTTPTQERGESERASQERDYRQDAVSMVPHRQDIEMCGWHSTTLQSIISGNKTRKHSDNRG